MTDSKSPVPFFSVCIPQFNRTSFLLRSLESLREQTNRDFEICISDGGSTDDRSNEIIELLQDSGMRHVFQRQHQPAPYDRNLRAAIGLATGRYCFLLGNDDMLAADTILENLRDLISGYECPEVVISNYYELSSGRSYQRVFRSGIIGRGVKTAIANFRNYSFVSGVLLNAAQAQAQATCTWDGSEMYQTFLATRIVAAGGRLLAVADTIIHKDIQVPGVRVDSYADQSRLRNPKLEERRLPLMKLGGVVMDALSPYLNSNFDTAVRRVFRQLLIFTYPPWLIEYRRIQSWRYAVGIALGMRPRNILCGLRIRWLTKLYVRLLYITVTLAGLVFPIRLFDSLKPRLHQMAKRS
jgi:glycosyltransferase involved in cell wall biosynthesis